MGTAVDPSDRGSDRALLRLTEQANRATTLDEVYAPALDAITALLGVPRASILLFDPDGVMRFKAWRGLSDGYRAAVEGHTPWSRDAVDPPPIVVPDAHADPELAAYRPVFDGEGIRALAFIPIGYGRELLGKFMAYDAAPRAFTERELELARAVATQVAQAVARARLLARERAARGRAERVAASSERLLRVTMRLSTALTSEDVAEIIVGEGHEAMAAYSTGLWLLAPDGDALVALATRNYGIGAQRAVERLPLADEIPLAHAVRRGEPVWIESRDAYAARFPASEARTRALGPAELAVACLPLRARGRTLGGLALAFAGARPLDADDRVFLELLAQHCAQGLERARLYDEAVRAVALRDEFLSIAGHELKTPLTALSLQAEMLATRGAALPGDAIAARGDKVLRHARRLGKLVDELLDVSRISAGRLTLHAEDADLAAIVAESAARLAEEAARAGAEVRLAGSREVRGRWDRMRLDQVVTNLLSNAIKYGGGRPIDAAVERDGATARVIVRDRGVGIAADDHARIFERFERAAPARNFGGLGLGLWIARQIVEAHGGTIAVRSAPGEGAEFRVELPLDLAPTPAAP